jgi:hypothetical protein
MKPINKFKSEVKVDTYNNTTNALLTTAIVLGVTFLLSLLSKEIALIFIITYLVFTVSLIRWTQQSSK